MSIGNLFGTGGESNSLYGTSLSSGGSIPPSSFIYFEWFIFQASTGQPATPTGGSWDFLTNTGVPPTGWSSTVNGVPANNLWFSVAFVDSRNPTNIVWSTTGLISASTSIYATAYADTFTGNGSTTNWTLSADPVTVNNLDVSINGVTQTPVTDYSISNTTFITTTAAPLGSIILVKYRQALPNSYYGSAANVQYTPAGTGAVATTVQAKLRQTVSVKDFGAVGDGVTNDYAAINAAWLYCYPIGANLYFPSGTYLVVTDNFPFRNTQLPVTSLLNCNNMTIYGDGPSSILKTSSVLGADVLQLNGLKNFHVRNLQVQSVISGSDAGSNGMSVTGGFDNITVDNFWAYNLAYVDKTTYVDGGKAVSIQPPSEANPITMGSFKATNIYADGCVYGFGYEPDNDLALTQPVSIEVDIVVSNSRQGVVFSAPAATSTLSANSTSGVRIRGQSINCMQDIVCGRTFGVDLDMQIIQTKTAAQLLLSYQGTQWTSVDGVADVIGVICSYAKNSRFVVYGNKKDCRHKVKIGGASEGSSGINGATDQCDFYFDIAGTSAGVDIQFNDAGGNIMNNSRLYCTTSTAITLPIEFYAPALDNTITIGPDVRLQSVAVTGQIGWTEADGRTVYHNKYLLGGNLSTRQTVGSSNDLIVEQWTNHAQTRVFAIRNDGYIATGGKGSASAVSTIKGIMPIYDENNTFYGYVPVYTSYS
jgi:hypothetical protein